MIIEYYDGGLQVVKADTDYQIASNFIAYNGVNIGEGYTEFERYDRVEEELRSNSNSLSSEKCKALLNEIGVRNEGTDKLQWSVIYNLSDETGTIWPHRDLTGAWDFSLE